MHKYNSIESAFLWFIRCGVRVKLIVIYADQNCMQQQNSAQILFAKFFAFGL